MLTEAQERPRAQLAARFAQSDSRVGAPRSTLSFLQNQIGAWNARDNRHARPAPPPGKPVAASIPMPASPVPTAASWSRCAMNG